MIFCINLQREFSVIRKVYTNFELVIAIFCNGF